MRQQDAPRYSFGFAFVVSTAAAAALLVLAYRAICARENKRRDGAGTLEGYDNAYDDDLTDKKASRFFFSLPNRLCVVCDDGNGTNPAVQNPQFRYIL